MSISRHKERGRVVNSTTLPQNPNLYKVFYILRVRLT